MCVLKNQLSLGQTSSASHSGIDTADYWPYTVNICLRWIKRVQSIYAHGTENLRRLLFRLAGTGYRNSGI